MVNKLKKNRCIIVVILFVAFVVIYWGLHKSDMFVDEICTYGLSNSYYAPFINDINGEQGINDTIITSEDIKKYMTVSPEDAFRFDSVYYNQTQDTQPPLYYMLIHFLCSIFQNSYSKWIGLSLNFVMYILICILLYKIGCILLKNKESACWTVLIYGISTLGLSTVLMIRMYILLTLLTILYIYILLRFYQEKEKKLDYIFLMLTLFAGMFTQYLYVITAFFISFSYFIYTLSKKQWKRCILFSISAISGLAMFVILYPAIFMQASADKAVSGATTIGNFLDFRGIALSIRSFVLQTMAINKGLVLALIVFTVLSIFKIKIVLRNFITDSLEKNPVMMGISMTTLFTVLFTAVIAPVTALRYIYNIAPMIILVAVYYMENICYSLWKTKIAKKTLGAASIVICTFSFMNTPLYVNTQPQENSELISQYTNQPCVYLEKDYNTAMTQDLLQLIRFKQIYVTDNLWSEQAQDYLSEHSSQEGIILYIDVDPNESAFVSKIVSEQILNCGMFEKAIFLFHNIYSDVYLLQ